MVRSARICCVLAMSAVGSVYLFLLLHLFRHVSNQKSQSASGGYGRPFHAPLRAGGAGNSAGREIGAVDRSGCVDLKFSPDVRPVVALVSFPGSGNTWVRHLLEQASGIYTGSIYFDRSLVKEGFKGEGITNGTVIAVKTHEWGEKIFDKYDKAILIIRNPFDAILAEFNRHFGGHRGHATKAKFEIGSVWRDFVEGKSQSWTDTVMSWVKFPRPLLILKYDELVGDTRGQLDRLLTFLGEDVGPGRLDCVLGNAEGRFHRKKMPLEFDPFTAEMRSKIEVYRGAVDIVVTTYNQYMCREWPDLCLHATRDASN